MYFVGIDLAWSEKNGTGVVILKGDRNKADLCCSDILFSDKEYAKPLLILPKEILEKNVKKLKAKALKDYEDLLDAIFCAYIAYYCWSNPDKCTVLGDMEKGYILTPVFDFMQKQLKDMKSQKRLVEF